MSACECDCSGPSATILVVLFFSDVFSDVFNGISFIYYGDVWWGSCILVLTVLPNIMLVIAALLNELQRKPEDVKKGLLFQVQVVPRFWKLVKMVYSRCCCKSNTSKEDVEDAFANLTNDCWTECMLESVPQFILQLMIFLRKPTMPGVNFTDIMRIIGLLSSLGSILVTSSRNQNRVASYLPGLFTKETFVTIVLFALIGIPRLTAWAFITAYGKGISIVVFVISIGWNGVLSRNNSITARCSACNMSRLFLLFTGDNYFLHSGSFIPVKQTMRRKHWPFIILSCLPLVVTLLSLIIFLSQGYYDPVLVSPTNQPPFMHCFNEIELEEFNVTNCTNAANKIYWYNDVVCANDENSEYPIRICQDVSENLIWPGVIVGVMLGFAVFGVFLDYEMCNHCNDNADIQESDAEEPGEPLNDTNGQNNVRTVVQNEEGQMPDGSSEEMNTLLTPDGDDELQRQT